MKTARIVLLLVIVSIVFIGGYFGANMYVQNRAIKKINSIIEQNHWENLVEYGDVKANVFKRSITIQNVKFTLENNITSQPLGVFYFKDISINGDWDTDYIFSSDNIDYTNLNSKVDSNLMNKKLFHAEYACFRIHKKDGIVDRFNGKIDNIMLNKSVFGSNEEKLEVLQRIVKINNPINIRIEYEADVDKNSLKLRKYHINFINNLGLSYKAYIKNVDFKGIRRASEEVKKNPKDFLSLTNMMSKIMQMKIINLDIDISDYGMIDRMLETTAEKQNISKQELIQRTIEKMKKGSFSSACNAVENFLSHQSKHLSIKIENNKNLSIGDILMEAKNKSDILNNLNIKIGN